MQDKLYTVLWYRHNPVLEKYRQKQYGVLLENLKKNISSEDFEKFCTQPEDERKKFLFHPDQSSILKCFEFLEDTSLASLKLHEELQKFLSWNRENMVMNSGLEIAGTNIRLSVEDNNPLNWYDAHPDSSDAGGKLWWWVQTPEEWKEVYDNTFALLKSIDEEFFEELNYMIQKIVPFGTAKHIHYSASYREAVGTLYMGYTLWTDIPELHVLEGLVHESTHNKLNLILQDEAITLNDFEEKYYSPYRPDARHIYWVFLGIHALIPTVYVLLQWVEKWLIKDMKWLEKIALYHVKNKIGIATMKKFWKLSEIWAMVYKDLVLVAQKSDTLVKSMIEKNRLPIDQIQRKAKEHFMEVNKNYPHLQY